MGVGLSTPEMPLSTLVGAFSNSIGLCSTGQVTVTYRELSNAYALMLLLCFPRWELLVLQAVLVRVHQPGVLFWEKSKVKKLLRLLHYVEVRYGVP